MVKCSTPLIIEEMWIKITVRYLLNLVRMAFILNIINKFWGGCRERGILVYYWWECKLVQPLWKTMWRFVRKLELTRSSNPTPRHIAEDLKSICQRDICACFYCSTVLQIVAQIWNQSGYPLTNEWIKKIWCICTP